MIKIMPTGSALSANAGFRWRSISSLLKSQFRAFLNAIMLMIFKWMRCACLLACPPGWLPRAIPSENEGEIEIEIARAKREIKLSQPLLGWLQIRSQVVAQRAADGRVISGAQPPTNEVLISSPPETVKQQQQQRRRQKQTTSA